MKRKITVTLLISIMVLASLMPTAFAASNCNNASSGNINDLLQNLSACTGSSGCSQPSASGCKLISGNALDPSILQQLKGCQQSGTVNTADIQSLLDQVKNTVASTSSCSNNPTNTCPTQPSTSSSPSCQNPAPTATKAPAPASTKTPVQSPAPTATKAPVQTTAPSSNNNVSYASDLEKQMVSMVNQERQAAGLPALIIDQGLTANARAHSADMAKNNYFSHTSPTYGSFSQRLKASGLSYSSAGENIARYNDVARAHQGLMNSEGHRANIMNSSFTHIGIGIVWDDDTNSYEITQWFAKLR